MRFLVVDDSPTIRRLVKVCLKDLGYLDSLEAEDGLEALSILKQRKVDVILTDWIMPNISGLELTNIVRANLELKDIPIIMITTKGEEKDIVEAVHSKINGYIVKPFTPEILNKKLKPIVENLSAFSSRKPVKLDMKIDNEFKNNFDAVVASFNYKDQEFTTKKNIKLNFDTESKKIVITAKLVIDSSSSSISLSVLDDGNKDLGSEEIKI